MPPRLPLPTERSAAERLAEAAYETAAAVAALLCVPAWPLLRRRGLAEGIGERLGRLPPAALHLPAAPLWIHAASVGETRAAAPLVAELRRRCPGIPLVVSATTATGRAVAAAELHPDVATLLPVDALRIIERVFCRLRPRGLILVETEIWPGLLRAAQRVGAPAVMVSGRLSARTLARYRWAGPLFQGAVRRLSALGMQSAGDAERIIALGALPVHVQVTGNLKGSAAPAVADAPPLAGLGRRPVLVAASTQPGEEEFVLAACAGLWEGARDLLLILAPRRPERFDAVERLVAEAGMRYQRRSRMGNQLDPDTQVLLLDTIGELPRHLTTAAAAFVGGTVAPLGGHNVLEPAACGVPVAFGPHTANVGEETAALVVGGGAVEVRTPDELRDFWRRMLAQPAEAAAMGARARAVAAERAEALPRTWALIAGPLGLPT